MRKKVVQQKTPRERLLKLPESSKSPTHSRDQTFAPSPSPPTSPSHTNPMARTKTTLRYHSSAKPTPPPKEPPSKPSSSKPSSSKGKHLAAAEEPIPESTQPKPRHSYLKRGDSVKQQKKEPTRSERVVLDNDDDESVPEDSPLPSTEGTSISIGQKSALFGFVKDVEDDNAATNPEEEAGSNEDSSDA
nr:pollen-specific leucine-rich repeat extensin-like protein 1 [Arachis hypogaea]